MTFDIPFRSVLSTGNMRWLDLLNFTNMNYTSMVFWMNKHEVYCPGWLAYTGIYWRCHCNHLIFCLYHVLLFTYLQGTQEAEWWYTTFFQSTRRFMHTNYQSLVMPPGPNVGIRQYFFFFFYKFEWDPFFVMVTVCTTECTNETVHSIYMGTVLQGGNFHQ